MHGIVWVHRPAILTRENARRLGGLEMMAVACWAAMPEVPTPAKVMKGTTPWPGSSRPVELGL